MFTTGPYMSIGSRYLPISAGHQTIGLAHAHFIDVDLEDSMEKMAMSLPSLNTHIGNFRVQVWLRWRL